MTEKRKEEEKEEESTPSSPPGSPRYQALEAEFKDLVKRSMDHLLEDHADTETTQRFIREMEDLKNRSLMRVVEKITAKETEKVFECCGRVFDKKMAVDFCGKEVCLKCLKTLIPVGCKIHHPPTSCRRVHPIPKSDPITIPPSRVSFHHFTLANEIEFFSRGFIESFF